MHNEVFLKFMSKKENISIIRNTITALLLEKNPTITFINELKTVFSEIITNCIVHGYDGEENNFIEIFVVLDDEIRVMGGATDVFRCLIENATYYMLLSGDGITVSGVNTINGEKMHIIVYYKYHRK